MESAESRRKFNSAAGSSRERNECYSVFKNSVYAEIKNAAAIKVNQLLNAKTIKTIATTCISPPTSSEPKTVRKFSCSFNPSRAALLTSLILNFLIMILLCKKIHIIRTLSPHTATSVK